MKICEKFQLLSNLFPAKVEHNGMDEYQEYTTMNSNLYL